MSSVVLKSLLNVGGGIGEVIGEIMKSRPHTKGINFDLPHVMVYMRDGNL